AHKGTVEAQSAGAGLGSVFTVKLPRQRPHLVPTNDERALESRAQPTSAHLLIVEDDEDTREVLQATLEARGFQVTACDSAAGGLETESKNSVDLIVSDLGMPEMD